MSRPFARCHNTHCVVRRGCAIGNPRRDCDGVSRANRRGGAPVGSLRGREVRARADRRPRLAGGSGCAGERVRVGLRTDTAGAVRWFSAPRERSLGVDALLRGRASCSAYGRAACVCARVLRQSACGACALRHVSDVHLRARIWLCGGRRCPQHAPCQQYSARRTVQTQSLGANGFCDADALRVAHRPAGAAMRTREDPLTKPSARVTISPARQSRRGRHGAAYTRRPTEDAWPPSDRARQPGQRPSRHRQRAGRAAAPRLAKRCRRRARRRCGCGRGDALVACGARQRSRDRVPLGPTSRRARDAPSPRATPNRPSRRAPRAVSSGFGYLHTVAKPGLFHTQHRAPP